MHLLTKIAAFETHAIKLRSIWLVGVLLLTACNEQELYSDLSERQANDMVAVLYGAGLTATKERSNNGSFVVLSEQSQFADAVNVLHANGMPQASYQSMGEVFAKETLVSSPLEERARLNYAMSQEIEYTISSIDGVLMARVHLAVPEQNPLSEEFLAASASVFVKHRADIDLTDSVARIKALVVNGIENLPYDNVTVALFESKASSLGRLRLSDAPVASMGFNISSSRFSAPGWFTGLSIVMFVSSLFLFGYTSRNRLALMFKDISRDQTNRS